jgi:hypothetical protein
MKNFIHFTIILFTNLFFGCEQKHEPIPKEEQFLKNVVVSGAEDVQIDLTERTIQILLPESFKSDIVDINIALYPGASMDIQPWDNAITSDAVHFYFKGSPPKQFGVTKKENGTGSLARGYTIYVKHKGEIDMELSSPLLLYPSGYATGETSGYSYATIKIKSGIGTIPDSPSDSKKIIPVLKDRKNNITVKGFHDSAMASFNFENTADLLFSSSISLSLSFGDKYFSFPGTQKILRAPARALLDANYKFFTPIATGKEIEVNGGFFLADANYRVKLESDFLTSSVELDVRVENSSVLRFPIPANVQDGNYLVSIIENDSVLTKQSYNIINNPTSIGIGHLWIDERSCPSQYIFVENSSPTKLQKGQRFYFMPFPAITHGQNSPIDYNKKLPGLEFKSGNITTTLTSATKAESCYADNTIVMYYGEYIIPTSMPSGKYEVRFIDEQGRRSLPYWNLIAIE